MQGGHKKTGITAKLIVMYKLHKPAVLGFHIQKQKQNDARVKTRNQPRYTRMFSIDSDEFDLASFQITGCGCLPTVVTSTV